MSAFGRSRRSVYLDADLWDLLKAAAPHETHDFKDEAGNTYIRHPHTAETLHDAIIRDWFQREDKAKYRSLLELREKAREEADARWRELTKAHPEERSES